MRRILKAKDTGFSFIELSVVLMVIAIVLGSALSVGVTTTVSGKYTETYEHFDVIEEALAAYVMENGFLPCPADASIALSSTTMGFESRVGGAGTDCSGNASSGDVHVGAVPIRTLQLPDTYLLDGWGRRITYAVDQRLAKTRTLFKSNDTGSIEIMTAADAAPADRTSSAVYVLVSHGKEAAGAWPRNGGAQIADSANADEAENSHEDAGNPFDVQFVQKDSESTFDDLVRYQMKYHILNAAGVVQNLTACEVATQVISDGGASSYCGLGGAEVANCESFFDSFVAVVDNLCLQ